MKKFLFSAAVLAVTALQAQDCSDLFFSEYVEGKLHNKALEIYNPTADAIDLSNYSILRYSNGSSDNSDRELILSGSLAPHDVVVVTHGDTTPDTGGTTSYIEMDLYNLGDLHGTGDYNNSPMFFNGNDALTLEKLDGTTVDIFGKVGEEPGNGGGWNDNASTGYKSGTDYWTAWTRDHTMVRKSSVLKGVTENPVSFNTSLEYDSLSVGDYSGLGSHTCDCSSLATNEYSGFSFLAFVQNNTLRINSKESVSKVELVNLNGQIVSNFLVSGNEVSVSLNLENGIYVLRLTSDNNKIASTKLVVK